MFGNKELQTKLAELEELNAGNVSQIEELNAKLEEYESLKVSNQELQENMKKVNALNEELNAKLEDLEAKQSDFDSKVADAAQNIVAQTGHEPLAEIDEDLTPSASIQEQYLSIKDKNEKLNFFKENKQQLFHAAFKK